VGKNFPLFRCRHTRKQVLTCQWEKRSICTFEEAVSRRETTSRPIPRIDSASNCYLTGYGVCHLQILLAVQFPASNMHVLVRWYQPGGVWKSKLIKRASDRNLLSVAAHRVSVFRYLSFCEALILLAWSSLSSPRRLTLAQRAPALPRPTSFARIRWSASLCLHHRHFVF